MDQARAAAADDDGQALVRRATLLLVARGEVDARVGAQGVVLDGTRGPTLTWSAMAEALAEALVAEGTPTVSPHRDGHGGLVAACAHLREWLGVVGALLGPARSANRVIAVGLPAGHVCHPGAPWVRERVPGGALDLGLGLLVPSEVTGHRLRVLPTSALQALGLDPATWWPAARERLDEGGGRAVRAWRRTQGSPDGLVPCGGHDVVSLLGAPAVRGWLAVGDEVGMAAVAVPRRDTGWVMTRSVDRAFAAVLAGTACAQERGFTAPVLVTADEVTLARQGPPGQAASAGTAARRGAPAPAWPVLPGTSGLPPVREHRRAA